MLIYIIVQVLVSTFDIRAANLFDIYIGYMLRSWEEHESYEGANRSREADHIRWIKLQKMEG